MEKNNDEINLKKPMDKFESKDDFISLKKEKILSLRKKKN